MSAVDLSFDKSCRLHLKSMVDNLFSRGKTFYDFPLRLTWIALSQEEADSLFRAGCPADVGALQMLVTVPKKKRRRGIREAYRINRRPLEDLACSCPGIRTLQLAFIYLKNENADYAEIERKMRALLAKVAVALDSAHEG